MIYSSSERDFWYEASSSALTYYLEVDGNPVYFGKAINPSGNARVDVGRRIRDYLETDMPDFRGYDGVVVPHPKQLRAFGLRDEDGNLLESYTVLLECTGEWSAYYGTITDPINGHADPRQKIFWTTVEELGTSGKTYPSNTGGGNYNDIVDDGGGSEAIDTGITEGGYLSFTMVSGSGEEEGVMIYRNLHAYSRFTIAIDFDNAEFYYSYGHRWVKMDKEHLRERWDNIRFRLKVGETIYFKSNLDPTGTVGEIAFKTFGKEKVTKITVQGNVASLTHLDNFSAVTRASHPCQNYYQLFHSSMHLVDASNLVLPYSPVTSSHLYASMFEDCEYLVTAPALPATVLYESGYGCYNSMFKNCKRLVTPPDLPALVIPEGGYAGMFKNCYSLNYIRVYATSTFDDDGSLGACGGWMDNVKNNETGVFYFADGVRLYDPDQGGTPAGFYFATGRWGGSGKPSKWGVGSLE